MKERIQKVLANQGVGSRRGVEEMVRQGRVKVNGKVVRDLPVLIDPRTDRVEVDTQSVPLGERGEERLYFLLNKPARVYATNVAQGEQMRAVDLLPPGVGRVYPVGRLDAESKGLLLLTNDGELTNRLTHPRFGVAKTYRAVADGFVNDATMAQLERGMWLADPRTDKGFKTGQSQVRVVSRNQQRSVLDITMRQGPNPQVRRALAKLGHKVRELTRIRIGALTLHGLSVGACRMLTPREVRELKKSVPVRDA